MSLLNPFEDFLISASQKIKNISFYSGVSEIKYDHELTLLPPTFATDEIFQIKYSHSSLLTMERNITFECEFKDIFGFQHENNCYLIYVKPDIVIKIYSDHNGPIDIRKDMDAMKRFKKWLKRNKK